MEEILELIHNEFINSEEYHIFLQRLDEEEFYKKNNKTLVNQRKLTKFVKELKLLVKTIYL